MFLPSPSRLPADRPRRAIRALAVVAAAALLGAAATAAEAMVDLHRGDPAPAIALTSVNGHAVRTADLRGDHLVLVFGETNHARTTRAMKHVLAAAESPDLARDRIRVLVILSSHSRTDDLASLGRSERRPPIVLPDPGRKAFGAYEVVALPTVVVVDADGRVTHSVRVLTDRLGDIVHDALLLAAGRMTAAQFDAAVRGPGASARGENEVRAERLVHLADELVRNELSELAESKYREALGVDPGSVPAHLRLADLLRRRASWDEAAELLASALALEPDSLEAMSGLAHVQALRGREDDLDQASALVHAVLERDPNRARAHYVQGLLAERRGDLPAAAASYRRAAELLQARIERGEFREVAGTGS